MIWNIKRNKKLKMVLTLVITVIALHFLCLGCFGVFYAEEFPSEIGLSGGYFVKFRTSVPFVVLIPDNYINSFAFQGNGTLINTTTSTISTRLFNLNTNSVVNARFSALGGLQYLSNNSWVDIGNYTVLDMNIYPKSADPDYANQNLHLDYNTRHLVIFIVLCTMLLIIFRSVRRE